MGQYDVKPCPCGSGKPSTWLHDARGIPCTRTCDDCHDEKVAKYRPEVMTDSSYDADEDIDGEPDLVNGRPEFMGDGGWGH